jgi:hypothetical protein
LKKSILLFAVICSLCFLSKISNAQPPNWLWATSAGGTDYDYASSVAVDASGNTYVAGWFASSTITFGSTTLTNANAGNGDMFLVKYDANGNVLWAKSEGGTSIDQAYSVAVDASGNSYVVGFFYSPTITIGSYTLTNAGFDDLFLAKYDANGNVLWAKSAGGTGYDWPYCIAVDASGNSYVAGAFYSSTITFGSYTLTNAGNEDMFLAKYDANGNVLWTKSEGGMGNDLGNSVAVDASGNPYVAGYFSSPTLTFGSYTLTNANAGINDLFLAKYDANGNVLWAKSIGGPSDDEATAAAVDASGNLYVAGWFRSTTLTFGSYTLTSAGNEDMFLAKYDANGNVLWAASAGGISEDIAGSVAVDASGNPYVAGLYFSSTLTFGSYTLTNVGYFDMFLTRYDANGNVLWAKSQGGTNGDLGRSIAVDASGNLYVAGLFRSPTLTFGSYTLTNAGAGTTSDMFLAKLGNSAGINESRNSSNISVFPNPATDIITIEITGIFKASYLSIMNIEGQQVITRQIKEPQTQLDISNLPSGVYFVKLTNDKTVKVGKMIKQ